MPCLWALVSLRFMNDTPKTDKVEHELHYTWAGSTMRKCTDGGWVEADFARELERECVGLKEALEKEKADHLDTQHKWNEALDIGMSVLKERDSLRIRISQLLANKADMPTSPKSE